MPATALGPVIALTRHPQSDDGWLAHGPFADQAAAEAYAADEIDRGQWDPACEVEYAELVRGQGPGAMDARPARPPGTYELLLAEPCVVVYDGAQALSIRDRTPDSDQHIVMSTIQRAVTIARLRAYADLLEQVQNESSPR